MMNGITKAMRNIPTFLLLAISLALSNLKVAAKSDSEKTLAIQSAADALFTNDTFLHLSLEISDSDLDSLRKNPRKWVPVTLKEDGRVYTNYTAHLKGSAGSFRPIDDKPGFTLKASIEEPQEAFHGLKKFHLNNSVQDPTHLSDWLCGRLFRAAGVPTARSTHSLVDLNGHKLGLYNLLESYDKEFLSHYFTNTHGNLYGQSRNADITEPLEREAGRGENTRADLKALAAAAREPDRAKLWEQLSQVLDVDRYLSFMAMEVMLCHWDGYTFATHNFRVYQDLDSGKMVFFPHDFDLMLEDPNVPIQPGANGLVSADILKNPQSRKLYQERFGTLFTNVFLAPELVKKIDRRLAQLLPGVMAYDPTLARALETRAEGLKNRVENRARALAQQLSEPIPISQFMHGLVLDSETQKPVPQCTITPGFGDGENAVRWERGKIYLARRGVFDMDLAAAKLPGTPSFFRFETPGYMPYVMRFNVVTNDEDPVYRIVLKKGIRIAGDVRWPDGSRASGGQVALLTESSGPVLGPGKFISKPGQQIIPLRELARFSFSPDPEARTVLAVHPRGFAEVPVEDLATKPQIVLQPWGRLEGNVTGGMDAIAYLTADLLIPHLFKGFNSGVLDLDTTSFTAETPADGPFTFEHIPPGERYLWRSIPIDKPTDLRPSNLGFAGQWMLIQPGQTNFVSWGENERSIKGRLALDSAKPMEADPNVIVIAENPFKLGCVKLAASTGTNTTECFFTFNEADTFRITGTLPARAQADFRVYNPPLLLGVARREISFPAGSASNFLDLGELKLAPIQSPAIGSPAPEFTVNMIDGTPMKLADFHGSLVLLYFSAAGCGTLPTMMPGLQAVWDQYHEDPRVVIVGLSIDRSREAARHYATRNGIKWRQAWLGEWFQTDLPSQYGVAAIPSAVLIGADGKLLARNIPFPNLAAEVQAALQAVPAPDRARN